VHFAPSSGCAPAIPFARSRSNILYGPFQNARSMPHRSWRRAVGDSKGLDLVESIAIRMLVSAGAGRVETDLHAPARKGHMRQCVNCGCAGNSEVSIDNLPGPSENIRNRLGIRAVVTSQAGCDPQQSVLCGYLPPCRCHPNLCQDCCSSHRACLKSGYRATRT